jgi:hydroxymethylbilane synthase
LERLIIIGTRGSDLALWQANDLKQKLSAKNFISELKIIKTKGVKIQDLSFDKIEGKGFFTTEIEEELKDKRIDIAVHSLKDLPTTAPESLVLGGLSERQDPSDLLIINKSAIDMGNNLRLKDGAIIGTSSVRRQSIVKNLAPQVTIKELRGNVPTRIQKLKDGHYDAIILASADVNRLEIDLSEYQTIRLNPKEFVPAPGQGVIAYQCREEDMEIRKILSTIHHKSTSAITNVERKVLNLMDGGCHIPLGVYTEIDDNGYYHVWASYAESINTMPVRINLSQSTSYNLAEKVVEQLKNNPK